MYCMYRQCQLTIPHGHANITLYCTTYIHIMYMYVYIYIYIYIFMYIHIQIFTVYLISDWDPSCTCVVYQTVSHASNTGGPFGNFENEESYQLETASIQGEKSLNPRNIGLCTLRQSKMTMEDTLFISDFPIKTSIPRGSSTAMFDCQRVNPIAVGQIRHAQAA